MGRSNWAFLAHFRGIKCQILPLNAVPTAGVKKNQKTVMNYLRNI
jgi:hypothetical protein